MVVYLLHHAEAKKTYIWACYVSESIKFYFLLFVSVNIPILLICCRNTTNDEKFVEFHMKWLNDLNVCLRLMKWENTYVVLLFLSPCIQLLRAVYEYHYYRNILTWVRFYLGIQPNACRIEKKKKVYFVKKTNACRIENVCGEKNPRTECNRNDYLIM